jgi:O-antigen/teichoic acid export membrane protein
MSLLRSEKAIVVLGRVIDASGSLVFLKLLSQWAPKGDVGQYLLATSALALFLTVTYSALDQGVMRNVVAYREAGHLPRRYTAILVAYLLSGAPVVCMGVALLAVTAGQTGLDGLWPMFALWLTFEALKNFNNVMASALRQRVHLVGASLLDYGVRIGLIFLAWRLGKLSAEHIIAVLAAASGCTALFYVLAQRAMWVSFTLADLVDTVREAFHFSWPVMLWGGFGWLQNMSSRWLLGKFMGLTAVAEFGVINAIATFPVLALFGLVGAYMVPILYEREHAESGAARRLVWQLAWTLVPVCLLIVLVASMAHELIVRTLTSSDYVAQSAYLPWLTGASILSSLGAVLTYAVYAQRRVSSLLLANTLPGAFSLVAGYFAVSRFGLPGAVATCFLGSMLSAILYVAAFRRHRQEIPTC